MSSNNPTKPPIEPDQPNEDITGTLKRGVADMKARLNEAESRLPTFRFFPRLPPELRLMIWSFTLPPPRLIIPANHVDRTVGVIRVLQSPRTTIRDVPLVLHINHESRSFALPHFTLRQIGSRVKHKYISSADIFKRTTGALPLSSFRDKHLVRRLVIHKNYLKGINDGPQARFPAILRFGALEELFVIVQYGEACVHGREGYSKHTPEDEQYVERFVKALKDGKWGGAGKDWKFPKVQYVANCHCE